MHWLVGPDYSPHLCNLDGKGQFKMLTNTRPFVFRLGDIETFPSNNKNRGNKCWADRNWMFPTAHCLAAWPLILLFSRMCFQKGLTVQLFVTEESDLGRSWGPRKVSCGWSVALMSSLDTCLRPNSWAFCWAPERLVTWLVGSMHYENLLINRVTLSSARCSH